MCDMSGTYRRPHGCVLRSPNHCASQTKSLQVSSSAVRRADRSKPGLSLTHHRSLVEGAISWCWSLSRAVQCIHHISELHQMLLHSHARPFHARPFHAQRPRQATVQVTTRNRSLTVRPVAKVSNALSHTGVPCKQNARFKVYRCLQVSLVRPVAVENPKGKPLLLYLPGMCRYSLS